jgi:hypothetical protein
MIAMKGRRKLTPEMRRDIHGLGTRLREVATHVYGLRGIPSFARALGFSPRTVYNWGRKAGSEPQAGIVLRIIVGTGVSPRWLLDGTGPMFADAAQAPCPSNGPLTTDH